MHTTYYGNKSVVDFDLTTHLKERNTESSFTAIPVTGFDTADEARAELDEAEQTLFKYKQMLEHIKRADEITDAVTCGTVQQDHMTEYDTVEPYGDSTMDVVNAARKNIELQILKFKKFCEDLEALIDDLAQQESDDEKYGTFEEQVRADYYATR